MSESSKDEPFTFIPKTVRFRQTIANKKKKINMKYTKLYSSFILKLNAARIDHYFIISKRLRTTAITTTVCVVLVFVASLLNYLISIDLYEKKILSEASKIGVSINYQIHISIQSLIEKSVFFSKFFAQYLNDDTIIPLNFTNANKVVNFITKAEQSVKENITWWNFGMHTGEVFSVKKESDEQYLLYYAPPYTDSQSTIMSVWESEINTINPDYPNTNGQQLVSYSIHDRDWYKNAISSNDTIVTEPYISGEAFGINLLISTATPVNYNSSVRGAFNTGTRLQSIQNIINSYPLASNSRLAVYTDDYVFAMTGETAFEIYNQTFVTNDIFSSSDPVWRCISENTNSIFLVPDFMKCTFNNSEKTYSTSKSTIEVINDGSREWQLLCMFCIDDIGILFFEDVKKIFVAILMIQLIAVFVSIFIAILEQRYIQAQQNRILNRIGNTTKTPIKHTLGLMNQLLFSFGTKNQVKNVIMSIKKDLKKPKDLYYKTRHLADNIEDEQVRDLFMSTYLPK